MRYVDQGAVKCDESVLEEYLKGFVVIFASKRVSVPFCCTTKVFKEGNNGGVVIVEQTRWRHVEERSGWIWACLSFVLGHCLESNIWNSPCTLGGLGSVENQTNKCLMNRVLCEVGGWTAL
jgi:hypothetical protein